MLFRIYAGIGEGFSGDQYHGVEEFDNRSEAEKYAYNLAIEEYQSWEGLHGIAGYSEIIDNPEYFGLTEGFSEDEVEEIYQNEIDSWIEYWVEEITG